jgi:hypothetical protein
VDRLWTELLEHEATPGTIGLLIMLSAAVLAALLRMLLWLYEHWPSRRPRNANGAQRATARTAAGPRHRRPSTSTWSFLRGKRTVSRYE